MLFQLMPFDLTEAFQRICSSKQDSTEVQEEAAQEERHCEVDNKEEDQADAPEKFQEQLQEAREDLESKEPDINPLHGFPPRFLKDAEAALAQLIEIEELSWDSVTGLLSIDQQRLSLTVTQLLRAICVPFTKPRIPSVCIELLYRHRIKPRNHLLYTAPEPKWHVYFKL